MSYQPAGWYDIDFARSRHTNIPVVSRDDWYQRHIEAIRQ